MKNNLAPIIMIAMYIVMMVKCKKIYLNISRDYEFRYIDKFKELIYLSAALSVLSCILLLYSSNISIIVLSMKLDLMHLCCRCFSLYIACII